MYTKDTFKDSTGKQIVVLTAIAPSHWAPYLINGDATGFDYSNTPDNKQGDRDFAACQAFEKWLGGTASDCTDAGFRHTHDASRFGVGASDCQEYTVLIYGNPDGGNCCPFHRSGGAIDAPCDTYEDSADRHRNDTVGEKEGWK